MVISRQTLISSNTDRESVWFDDNLDVFVYGTLLLSPNASLTSKNLISIDGLSVNCGTNKFTVSTTNAAINRSLLS